MIRNKWSVGLRNTLSSLMMECDSCAAIEGAKMTRNEREELQKQLKETINWIDKRISKK
jgi:hypothetical protein